MKTLLALILLMVPVTAHATPVNYVIFFHDSPFPPFVVDWTGHFTVDNGIVTSFIAMSPFCGDPAKCTYLGSGFRFNVPIEPVGVVLSTIPFPPLGDTADLILHSGLFFPQGTFSLHTPIDPGFGQDIVAGTYITAVTAEPSALWLLLAGSLVFAWQKFSKRWRVKNLY